MSMEEKKKDSRVDYNTKQKYHSDQQKKRETLHSIITIQPFLFSNLVLQKGNISLKVRYKFKRIEMINNPVLILHRSRTSIWQQQNNRAPYILLFIML